MSEPQQMSSPPPPPPPLPPEAKKKKGFGVLAWVAIGCIGVLVIGGLLAFACTAILANKAKNFIDEAGDNPTMAAAEMVVRFNPNLELVEKDEEAGTLTIYDKQQDKTLKLDLDDVMQGKFNVETSDGETMNFDFGQNENGTFRATLTDEKGGVSEFSIGGVGKGADELPAWLPVYKNAELSSPLLMNTAGKVSGTAMFSTPDPIADVAAAMTQDLENRGFKVERASYEAAGVTSVILTCKGPVGQELTVSVSSRGEATGVVMSFSGKP
ncbi:MAG: hypothetical protein IH936_07815 [Acidobacteria bacterium]|nr:hypothetical protein [Acidobacteriota bacterium]